MVDGKSANPASTAGVGVTAGGGEEVCVTAALSVEICTSSRFVFVITGNRITEDLGVKVDTKRCADGVVLSLPSSIACEDGKVCLRTQARDRSRISSTGQMTLEVNFLHTIYLTSPEYLSFHEYKKQGSSCNETIRHIIDRPAVIIFKEWFTFFNIGYQPVFPW
jgi:hypothetical protein